MRYLNSVALSSICSQTCSFMERCTIQLQVHKLWFSQCLGSFDDVSYRSYVDTLQLYVKLHHLTSDLVKFTRESTQQRTDKSQIIA